jgi:hypothetical protein
MTHTVPVIPAEEAGGSFTKSPVGGKHVVGEGEVVVPCIAGDPTRNFLVVVDIVFLLCFVELDFV